jgi:hypothetical protein
MIRYATHLAIAAALSAAGALAQTNLSCPDTVEVAETATPVKGWNAGGGGKAGHKFERVSIYNGKSGGQEYELAPDDEKKTAAKIVQTWNLKDYRSMPLFLRCRYRDTSVVLVSDLAPALTTCTFTFTLDRSGNFLGKSVVQCH